jgi:hypothetical protein
MPQGDAYIALVKRFRETRDAFPEEQLAPYAGQWIAWWPDGSRIVDTDPSLGALKQRLRDAGYSPSWFALELVPLPGQTELDPFVALHMHFAENRNNFPLEELAKYAGKCVAWWPDGTRIIDADSDGQALIQRLRDNGHDLSFLVLERIPFLGETYAG